MPRVGWGFVSLYTLAYVGTCLVLIAPLLVTLALKVNSLVGIEQAPSSLGLVSGIASLLAIVGNPFFGKLSDRTSSRLGMRRPWMIIGLVGGSLGVLTVAVAPNIPIVLVGWCTAQQFFNALLAALIAVGLARLMTPTVTIPVVFQGSAVLLLLAVAAIVGVLSSLVALRRAVAVDPALAFGG